MERRRQDNVPGRSTPRVRPNPRTFIGDLPRGLVPRIESGGADIRTMRRFGEFPWIMIDITYASSLAARGVTAQKFYPEGRVVTTSTIHDDALLSFDFDRELRVVSKFGPACHVPCDRPVYLEDSPAGRAGLIDDCVRSTIEMAEELRASSVRILPLIKGVNQSEWSRCAEPLRRAGFIDYACYVRQFFGHGTGRRAREMVEHIRGIIATCDPRYVILIGFQSPKHQADFPPAVRAFAGQRWRRVTVGTDSTGRTLRRSLRSLLASSNRAGKRRQSVLHETPLAPEIQEA